MVPIKLVQYKLPVFSSHYSAATIQSMLYQILLFFFPPTALRGIKQEGYDWKYLGLSL